MTQTEGRTIALYGDSGAGKSTQIGEIAKDRFKRDGKRTLLNTSDLGGYDSILPLRNLGILRTNDFDPENDNPWHWINDSAGGKGVDDSIGVVAFDSGTSMGEALLNAITKEDMQIGQRKTQKFPVAAPSGGKTLVVGLNNDAHYGLVQNFMLDAIWKSTWLTRKGIDVVWTFATHRGENTENEPIVGPKLVGKALTPAIPKWFKYTFRLVTIPQMGGPSKHVLYIQEQPGTSGLTTSFGNPRYPLDAASSLPSSIEPASVPEALRLIEAGQKEAEDALKLELGL